MGIRSAVLLPHRPARAARVHQVTPERGHAEAERRRIGVGFIPDVLNRSVLDEVIAVTDDEAFGCARRVAREEGIIAGVSSGAALPVASCKDAAGKTTVVLLADTGERYITTTLFARKGDER